ncbi:792_t:CDS:2 [Dentiscutata heterogama]|uniref:792_t:CDS:1 n=1 Tax=Dentiscutata heterogama TaxID=1316150 RepID=A0ACA9M5I9_9GLOM|nr:792_t:CDS:2 [Dentiscutata heterogama]
MSAASLSFLSSVWNLLNPISLVQILGDCWRYWYCKMRLLRHVSVNYNGIGVGIGLIVTGVVGHYKILD